MVLTISMFPGTNRWCMIILMSKCCTCQYVGFHKETYKFQSIERSYGKYKYISPCVLSERERERETETETERIIMCGKYPGQYINCMIYSDQTVRKYSRHVNIRVCFKMGSFLSFLKSRKTYSGRTFSLISLSFITPPKNKHITWHSLLHRRFYLFIRCFIDLWGGNVCSCLWHVTR